ncbi:MAG: hypothetical protein ACYS9X_20180 [Planctomycetota bacterium]
MEPSYGFFHTASGCLAGIVCAIVYVILGFLVLLYLPAPAWLRGVALVAVGIPVIAPAFIIDHRSRKTRD